MTTIICIKITDGFFHSGFSDYKNLHNVVENLKVGCPAIASDICLVLLCASLLHSEQCFLYRQC